MSWVLIFYVIHWGESVTSNTVRFQNKKACFEAIEALKDSHLDSWTSRKVFVKAVCIQDK